MKNQILELQHAPVMVEQFQPSLLQKRTISELSENEMLEIEGGTSTLCVAAAAVGVAAGVMAIGYYTGKAIYYATH